MLAQGLGDHVEWLRPLADSAEKGSWVSATTSQAGSKRYSGQVRLVHRPHFVQF
jgi:hypothetical protein